MSLDRALLKVLTRSWDDGMVNSYPERIRKHEEAIPAPIAETFQTLDAKSAGLLTHVSMMIAGLALIAPLVANHDIEMAVIVFQIAVYLLIAIGCLRCLTVFSPRGYTVGAESPMDEVGREFLLRRELYRLCSHAAIYFTVIVFITLPVLYLF
jgi:hypothetical protein